MSLWGYKDANDFMERSGYVIDGIWYPRVTKIVEIKSKPALYFYYAEAASYAAANASTKKSAEEGTLIHNTIEKILLGENPEIEESVRPAIAAFKDFFEKNSIQTSKDFIEKRILSREHRYAGTIDALVLLDGKFGVLDVKTSQSIYRDYNLQTSAYMDALKNDFRNLQTRWILRVDQIKTCLACEATMRPKGDKQKIRAATYGHRMCPDDSHEWGELKGVTELKEFPCWKGDFSAFLGAKKLWEWENDFWLRKVGY